MKLDLILVISFLGNKEPCIDDAIIPVDTTAKPIEEDDEGDEYCDDDEDLELILVATIYKAAIHHNGLIAISLILLLFLSPTRTRRLMNLPPQQMLHHRNQFQQEAIRPTQAYWNLVHWHQASLSPASTRPQHHPMTKV